jgi:hypothetical protein
MRQLAQAALVAVVVLVPTLAHAQSLAGVVRDASGAVLPGVNVEAASPVLIEKVRSTVTDGTGQYRIPELTPGTYQLTFSLPGFTTVKREGVEVSGAQIITINADMRVGGVQETITVTGETPVVDVQSSTRRTAVIDDSVVEALPASRGYGNLLATVPGIQATGLNSGANPVMNFFTARGGRGNEGTVQIEGMNVGSAFNGGGVAGYGYDTANAAEIQITIAGGLGETDRGGPAFNLIPKTGGNSFSGNAFYSTAGRWSQGNNLDDRLRGFGITEVPGLIKNWDTSFALGGPIKRDRLWFYTNLRTFGAHTDIPGLYANKNAGDASRWDYVADPAVKARGANDKKIVGVRLTAQASLKNKFGFYHDYQKNCTNGSLVQGGGQCRDRGDDWVALGAIGGFGSTSPESGNLWDDREKIVQGTWSSPVTSRLLLEAGVSSFNSRWGGYIPAGADTHLIPVTELSNVIDPATGQRIAPVPSFTYRGWPSNPSNDQQHNVWRASGTYVTGAHSLKVGYQAAYQVQHQFQTADSQISYTFNSSVVDGVLNRTPTQFTLRDAPHELSNRTRFDALYVQDQWTRGRLTLQGGLRYEHAWSWFPEGENGILADNRFGSKFIFPESKGVTGYHDITPRMGAAYDVFGNGKTSLKVNYSKYLQAANNDAQFTIANPGVTFQQTTNRSWTDGNRNFVVDCALTVNQTEDNRAAGGDFCGPYSVATFGSPFSATRVNPDVLHGWGVRPYDWQFGVSVQHEILPRVSVDASYNRRWWGNIFYTDNLALTPADFDVATITAPSNPGLPNGGGYPVTFVTRNARTALGASDLYYTFASDYGDVTHYWHGVDLTVNARMSNGLNFQGGTSTGRGVRDNCAVTEKVPELFVTVGSAFANQQVGSCAVTEDWLTSFRGLLSYTLPKIDVLVSAVLRSQANAQPSTINTFVASNGASISANYNVSSAILQTSNLARPLAVGLPFQTVDLTLPGHLYGDRVNSVDMRFAKIVRFAGKRANVGIDLYNLFNANTGTAFNAAWGADGSTWLRPTTIMDPRFVRFNVTFDF